jgi:hypothetical protein
MLMSYVSGIFGEKKFSSEIEVIAQEILHYIIILKNVLYCNSSMLSARFSHCTAFFSSYVYVSRSRKLRLTTAGDLPH